MPTADLGNSPASRLPGRSRFLQRAIRAAWLSGLDVLRQPRVRSRSRWRSRRRCPRRHPRRHCGYCDTADTWSLASIKIGRRSASQRRTFASSSKLQDAERVGRTRFQCSGCRIAISGEVFMDAAFNSLDARPARASTSSGITFDASHMSLILLRSRRSPDWSTTS